MYEQRDTEIGKQVSLADDPAFEDFDLLGDIEDQEFDLLEDSPWPRNTAYVTVLGRTFMVQVEEADYQGETFTFDELEHFILGVETFIPRNDQQTWLHEYLVNAGDAGALREDLMADAKDAGYSDKSIGRTAKAIGVRYKREGFGKPSRWYRK